MKPSNARIVFFGTDDFSVPTLEALIAHGYEVVAAITKPDSTSGRGRETSEPAVKTVASEHHVQVLQPTKVSEILAEIEGLRPDLGVVVSYGKILPQALIDLFPRGLINIHTSLLPKYRGASPIEAAILNGDEATGITLMRIDAGMDTGPIYVQEKVDLSGQETQASLSKLLSERGSQALVKHLPAILDGSLEPVAQDNTSASTVPMIRKIDGEIDWAQPAVVIERRIRAFNVWPRSRATLMGVDVIITAVRVNAASHAAPGTVFQTESGDLGVVSANGSLIIERLKPAGKREMTGQEFLAGHPIR